ncbi:MAG: insulinase family protein [Hyphomicrobiales bacterium]|nr:insulinase family protein [Hyphomicrobiales bacterium]MDE2114108.1 insulinase family protein [Hyphomicrobiales bacterium]
MQILGDWKRAVTLAGAILAWLALSPIVPLAKADALHGWPQDQSDIKADPNAHFGILPNGMHYIVVHNSTPPHQASLRLRIGSGSAEETDDEQGLAHVLEHMSFKGSKNVPAGEMVHILERKGLAFGADTNAQTGFNATTYQLDLPETSEDTLQTGLMLLRETAGNLTLDAKALEPERGVVLSEERLRDTPQYRASTALTAFMMPGQFAPLRFPIGKVDIIKHAPVSLIRKFYEANYRPERTVLICVGDFDADKMIARIQSMFGDWKPVGPATQEPVLGKVAARGLTAKVVHLPGNGTQIKLFWAQPYDNSPDRIAKENNTLLEMIGVTILQERLARLATVQNPPFLNATAFSESPYNSIKISGVAAETTPQNWKTGFDEIVKQERQITQFGVSNSELKRALTNLSSHFERLKDAASTTPNVQIVDNILSNIDSNSVYTNAKQDYDLFASQRPNFTKEAVDAALKRMFSGSGPLLEMSTPANDITEPMLLAEFNAASATKLTTQTSAATGQWPYADFGAPGKVIRQSHVDDLDFTQVEFANHVRLNIKSTHFRKDQILVQVALGNGRLGRPKDQPSILWALHAFTAGGLGKASLSDINEMAAGKAVAAEFSMDTRAFQFSGHTNAHDLTFQLQLLAAYLKDPGFRPTALEQARANILAAFPQIMATPMGVLQLDLQGLLHNGDLRWVAPTPEQVRQTPASVLKDALAPVLAKGDIEITLVGDVDVASAIRKVAATFGALPERSVSPLPKDALKVQFPAANSKPVALEHGGRADQTVALVAWPGPDLYTNVQTDRALILAESIFQDRLTAQMRVKQGATYSPQGLVDLSAAIPNYGYTYLMVETKPEFIDDFYQLVQNISEDIAKNGVSDDELLRAKAPSLEQRKHMLTDNGYWLGALSGSQREPRQLDNLRTLVSGMQKIDAAEVQKVTAQYLTMKNAYRLVVRPQDLLIKSNAQDKVSVPKQ